MSKRLTGKEEDRLDKLAQQIIDLIHDDLLNIQEATEGKPIDPKRKPLPQWARSAIHDHARTVVNLRRSHDMAMSPVQFNVSPAVQKLTEAELEAVLGMPPKLLPLRKSRAPQ